MRSDRTDSAPHSAASVLFGVRIAGVGVLLPTDQTLEYVASATCFPLPGAGRRVVGMMQLRGHPVVVLDAEIRRAAVLVIGTVPEAGAVLVDAPPEQVETGEVASDAARPGSVFDAALSRPSTDARHADRLWWHTDVRHMFRILAGD
jgi:hypothetical protein